MTIKRLSTILYHNKFISTRHSCIVFILSRRKCFKCQTVFLARDRRSADRICLAHNTVCKQVMRRVPTNHRSFHGRMRWLGHVNDDATGWCELMKAEGNVANNRWQRSVDKHQVKQFKQLHINEVRATIGGQRPMAHRHLRLPLLIVCGCVFFHPAPFIRRCTAEHMHKMFCKRLL